MNKLLQNLYRGRIPGWDSQVHTTETNENNQKISNARKHLISLISGEALESFKKLEAFHAENHARRYENTYTNAFKLGVMLMCAVFADNDDNF